MPFPKINVERLEQLLEESNGTMVFALVAGPKGYHAETVFSASAKVSYAKKDIDLDAARDKMSFILGNAVKGAMDQIVAEYFGNDES
jgi:hypothetical protein